MNGKIIINEINKLLPRYVKLLSKLVNIKSVHGKEKEAQLLIKAKLEELGLKVKVHYSRKDLESMNLVSIVKGSSSRGFKSLILNAHSDVMPIDGEEGWLFSPFSGEIKNNILYGRGSCDDKAGIVIILLVINIIKNLNIPLKGDLIAEIVIDEETTGNGSKVLSKMGYKADGVIICDGTWSERIIHAHLGQVWLDVEVTGLPVAGCVEQRGINPIYVSIKFINRLREFIEELNNKGHIYEGIERPYYVNIGSFHSGVSHGSVPAKAKLEVQIGFSNKFTPDVIVKKVKMIAERISNRIKIKTSLLKTRAYKTDKNNPLINNLKSLIEANYRGVVSVKVVSGYSDMGYFKTKNICLYGPGGGKNPHSVNEQYFLKEMPKVTYNLLTFIQDWCNTAV